MKFLWLFEPDTALITPFVTASLWTMGGGGVLAFRRFGVGLFLALSALSLGLPWYLAWLIPSIFLVITSLPYGDSIRGKLGPLYYPYLFTLGVLYGLSNFVLCFHFGRWLTLGIGSLSLGCLFSLLTYASQNKALRSVVQWKAVEIAVGFGVGFIAYKLY